MKNLPPITRILISCLLIVLCNSTAGISAADDSKTFTAFSLNAARQVLESNSGDVSAVRTLSNITKIFGIVVDRNASDIIIVGQREPGRSEIMLDDLVAALRSIFVYGGEEAPGVSIDPRGDMRTSRMQDVRFFGGVQDTRFGDVCYEADYLMKKIGLGLQTLRIEGFDTYFDLSVEEMRNLGSARTEVGSRFWFYPIVARVVSAGDGVFLDNCRIEVLTQILYADVDGEPVDDLSTFNHRPSEEFAICFTSHMDELGEEYPVITDLENLTELTAVARGLSKIDNLPGLGYWLNEYQPDKVKTETEVAVLFNENKTVGLIVSGGVYLQSLAVRLKEGDAGALTDVVSATRPSKDSLSWTFVLTRDWNILVEGIPGEADASTAAEYYIRADYFFQARKYDQAIACWRQVLKIYPDMGEIYFRIGAAFERKGLLDAAADYYTKGMNLDPFLHNRNKGF